MIYALINIQIKSLFFKMRMHIILARYFHYINYIYYQNINTLYINDLLQLLPPLHKHETFGIGYRHLHNIHQEFYRDMWNLFSVNQLSCILENRDIVLNCCRRLVSKKLKRWIENVNYIIIRLHLGCSHFV